MAKVSIVFEDRDDGTHQVRLEMEYSPDLRLSKAEASAMRYWGIICKTLAGICPQPAVKDVGDEPND